MTGLRTIPITPLNHDGSCRICAAVDRYYQSKKLRRASAETPTAAGGSAPHARVGRLGVSADVREPSTGTAG